MILFTSVALFSGHSRQTATLAALSIADVIRIGHVGAHRIADTLETVLLQSIAIEAWLTLLAASSHCVVQTLLTAAVDRIANIDITEVHVSVTFTASAFSIQRGRIAVVVDVTPITALADVSFLTLKRRGRFNL